MATIESETQKITSLQYRLTSKVWAAISIVGFMIYFWSYSQLASGQATSGYHLLSKTVIGGEGGWDYLSIDTAAHRLYISRGTRADVFDIVQHQVIGSVPNTSGIHGIALAPEFNRGYTSNGKSNTCTAFDLKTLAFIGEAKTGDKPDAIIYDSFSKRVFVFNGKSEDATVIDAYTGVTVGTIKLGGAPEFAVSDEHGTIYNNIEDKNEVVAIDAQTLVIKNRWSLSPGQTPTGISMDRTNRRLFIGCRNQYMIILDADKGTRLASLPIGPGVDATAFDPILQLAFSSNGSGSVTVIHEDSPDTFSVIDNVATFQGAKTMTLDPVTHHLFLVTAASTAPSPAADHSKSKPDFLPNTFMVLEYGK
jgi:DNA-binding beta-propeller fold protein YncE